jgi:predicted PurR-regulated permease PerM
LHAFFHEFHSVAHALIYGNTLTAVLQGVVAWGGFWVAGVHHPGVWATALAAAALLPLGLTSLVWLPLAIVSMGTGHVPAGIFLVGWGVFAVGGVDSILRPKLCGARMALHPLLVFLSMFGGAAAFGLAGLMLGPLAASLLMAMLRIYRRDFLKVVSSPSYAVTGPLEPAAAALPALAGPVPLGHPAEP